MGAGADAAGAPRFPSRLIKPDVPISSLRLSEASSQTHVRAARGLRSRKTPKVLFGREPLGSYRI